MAPIRRKTEQVLEGPSEEGFIPPDPDAVLEQRRAEIKAASEKPDLSEPELTVEEEQEALELINAGRKETTFDLFGRTIRLRTLTIEEELKVSEITKPYIGSDGYPRAYRTAVVAAAIRTIDGDLFFTPMSESEYDQIVLRKYLKLLDYYPLAVDQIYARYRDMELELLALVDKLGKSQG